MKVCRQSGQPDVARIAVVMLLWVATVACGADGTPVPSPAPSGSPYPTAVTTTYPLGVTAWYAGLVVRVDRAMSVIDERGGSLKVDLRLENTGPDPATFGLPLELASGGVAIGPIPGTIIPDVPAGSSAGMTVQFDLGPTFDLPRAAIRIGRPAEHTVVVPLVAGSQTRVTLDPQPLVLGGTARAGALAVTLTSGELRADLPDWGLELSRSAMALTLTYTARYMGTFSAGFAFTGANLGLVLPDGTVISARPDGHSQSVAVLKPGTPMANMTARFEIPAPGPGAYSLLVSDAGTSASIKFTVAAPGSTP